MSARRCGRGKPAIAILAALHTATTAAAQNPAIPDLDPGEPPTALTAPAADHDTIQVPSGGQPFVVTRVDGIPPQLKAAIDRTNCNVTDSLVAQFPVLIFRPADGRRLMAVVSCSGPAPDSRAFLFDQQLETEPSPMTFPVVAPTGGFSASNQPGLMSWEAHTRTLTAWRGSDQCPGLELRHTYRQGSGELNGFALSKVEHRLLRCMAPESDWQTLWQSPVWNLQP
ncbi:MAG: hypothetical protein GEU95_09345 [Rhizobiales bacterium]|nr:hypothetical protein [Hyphomicrobiales bacterium]